MFVLHKPPAGSFLDGHTTTALRLAWQPLTVAGSELSWLVDGWNWLVALLLLVLVGVALLLQDESILPWRACRRAAGTLWLGSAALVFVFSGNVVTLAGGWVLLDAALAWKLQPDERAGLVGRAWGLLSLGGLLVLGAFLLQGEVGARASLAHGPFDVLELALLWVAALLRAGVYPLHLWLNEQDTLSGEERICLHLIAPLTGLWLLARLHEAAGLEWLRRPEWAALGALALLGSALASWTERDKEHAWRWIAINRASLVVMAAYVADTAGPPALGLATLSFALGLALLATGQAVHIRWGWTWLLWLGALAVWGLPGTPGFFARSALVLPVSLPGAWLLFVIMAVAETLLVASLWHIVVDEPFVIAAGTDRVTRPVATHPALVLGLGAMIVLLAVPTLTWGVVPSQFAAIIGAPQASMPVIAQVLLTARRSVWALLAFSAVGGVILGLLRERILGEMRGWQQGINALVRLDWLFSAVGAGFNLVASGLQYFARLGEGAGYVGWLMLAGLVLWVLLRG